MLFTRAQIGFYVYQILQNRKLKQREIASLLGIDQQEEFTRPFGMSKRTVQDWEQHRRPPCGPSRAFLVVIDREPEVVRRALSASAVSE